jgi:hypothetical protein
MQERLAHRHRAAERDAVDSADWHELAVANSTFLLERLGSECADLQGLRELTVNGLDAITAQGEDSRGRVVWDIDWLRFDPSGGRSRKLSVIDTGTGMTPEQLHYYINQLAASGREQSSTATSASEPRWPQARGILPALSTAPGMRARARWSVSNATATAGGTGATALGGRAHRLLAAAERSRQAVASRWGEEFAAAMRDEIRRLQERAASGDCLPRQDAIRSRVTVIMPLYRLSRYRPTPPPSGPSVLPSTGRWIDEAGSARIPTSSPPRSEPAVHPADASSNRELARGRAAGRDKRHEASLPRP